MKTILYFRDYDNFRILDEDRSMELGPFDNLSTAIKAGGFTDPSQFEVEVSKDFFNDRGT